MIWLPCYDLPDIDEAVLNDEECDATDGASSNAAKYLPFDAAQDDNKCNISLKS